MLSKSFLSIILLVSSFFSGDQKNNEILKTPAAQQNGIRVSIQVNSSKQYPVNNYFFGMMTENMLEKFDTHNSQFVKLAQSLGVSHFQYPGGSISYYWHYAGNTAGYGFNSSEYQNSDRHVKSRSASENYLMKLIDLCKLTNTDLIFVANILYGNPAELDAAISACNQNGVKVPEVILGVELQLPAMRSKISLNEYVRRSEAYIQMLHSKYPAIKIYANGAPAERSERDNYNDQWNQTVGKIPGIDGMQQYQWWRPNYGGSNTSDQFNFGLNDLKRHMAELDQTNQTLAQYSPHWVIDQWGVKEEAHQFYSGTMLQFFHICWYLLYAVNYNYYHPGFYQSIEYMKMGSSYSQDLINMTNKKDPSNPGYTINAAYFAFQFMQNIKNSNYAPASVNGDKNVMAWYFEKSGTRFLMIINLNNSGGTIDHVTVNGQEAKSSASKGYWSDALSNQMNNIKAVTADRASFNGYSVTMFQLN